MTDTTPATGRNAGAPAWMTKHPCESCGAGYGICAQGLAHNLMCCKSCAHPTRWQPDPWTLEEYETMWKGKNPPQMVLDVLARKRAEAARDD